jgi:hypothetical protein
MELAQPYSGRIPTLSQRTKDTLVSMTCDRDLPLSIQLSAISLWRVWLPPQRPGH